MNKFKVAAVASLLSTGFTGAVAADGPEVFGRINLSYQIEDTDTPDSESWQLRSNASRVGVRGNLPLSEDLTGFYHVEFAVDVVDSDGGLDVGREQFAGVRGNFGELFYGRHNSPVKLLGMSFDRFNQYTLGDIRSITLGENRLDNILAYRSPSFGGFTLLAMASPGEETTGSNNDPANSYSASLTYQQAGLTFGFAVDNKVAGSNQYIDLGNGLGVAALVDTYRVVFDYADTDFGLSALFQISEDSETGDNSYHNYGLSGQFNINTMSSIKAQYSISEDEGVDANIRMVSVGFDHKLSEHTKVFAFLTTLDDSDAFGNEPMTVGIGLEQRF